MTDDREKIAKEIGQLLAQIYCVEPNTEKVFDPDLIQAGIDIVTPFIVEREDKLIDKITSNQVKVCDICQEDITKKAFEKG